MKIFLSLILLAVSLLPMNSRAANVTLKPANDASGTTSFTGSTNWSNNGMPSGANNYFTGTNFLRTPPDGNNYTFGGASLTLQTPASQGAPMRSVIFKGASSSAVLTINNWTNAGGVINQGSGTVGCIFAGNVMFIATPSTISSDQGGPFVINSPLAGSANWTNSGSGTITYNGTNTFTGNIINSGILVQGANGVMTFKISGNGTNNSISGSGTATFNGRFRFDFSTASTNIGHSWTLVSTSAKTFGGTFSVENFTKQGFGTGAGIWNVSTNGAYYEFNTASGVLSVVATPSTGTSTSLTATSVKFEAVEADLLAAYDQTYASSVGGEDNAQVIIANAVAGQNHINDHSGTGARMRIIGYYQGATYNYQSSTLGGYVGWMANYNSRLSDVVDAGTAAGADLVVYICEPVATETAAGVAQQPGMYSSLAPSAVWSAVFAHETGGHNYGRSHSDGLLNPKTVMLHNYCGGGSAPPYYFSNPKIWFNSVQIQGDGNNCSQGSLINGGDNSLPSADNAVSVADRRTRIITGPNLTNVVLRWLFTNAPAAAVAGTTNLDLIFGASAIVRGNGATYTGNAVRLPGGTTGNVAMDSMAAYIDLPNGIISSRTNLTIEIWATPLSAPSWARLMDFGRTTEAGNGAPGEWTGLPGTAAPGSTSSSDDIMLSTAVGTDISSQRFEAKLDGVATSLDSGLTTAVGVPHHYAITFADGAGAFGANGGRWQWYRDGDAIAFLDVSNHLAQIEDVNNWLGRSQWSGDANANSDYAEVRISSVAMSRGEVVANYLIGPNYSSTTTVALNASDASGSSSFAAAGQWNNAAAPTVANNYESFDFWLRTPATVSSYTFGGNALKLSGGSLLYKSTGGSTITVTNLILNGGVVHHSGSGTMTLAGNIVVTTNGAQFNAQNGPITVTAPINGLAPVSFIGGNTVTLSGNNSNFLGKTFIGNGWFGSVTIDSPARLGTPPSAFTSDHLSLNRGTLATTATMTLSNDNRGILLDASGGIFNVAASTTLTLASTLSSPATDSANVIAGGLTKAGAGTLVLSTTNSTFKGGVWLDSGSTTANDGVVKIVNNQALANARSPFFIRNNNTGSSELQLDGSAGGITLSQSVLLSGRTAGAVAIRNVAGTNTIAGGLTITTGGSIYYLQSDAGQFNLGGSVTSSATGARTLTFYGAGNYNLAGVVADGSATMSLVKNNGGTLTLAGANTFTGTTTVGGGTLLVNGSTSTGSVIVGNTATLGGNGTIGGPLLPQAGATIAPGTGIGRLTATSSVSLVAGSTVWMEISKSPQTNDSLVVGGTLQFGGTLVVTNLAGALAAGDAFQLFNAAAFTGSFTTTNLPMLAAGLAWSFNAENGLLRVVSTASTNLAVTPAANAFNLSWPSDRIGWRLQSQTNSLGTNWSTVSGSMTTNLMLIPFSSENENVFFRLIFP